MPLAMEERKVTMIRVETRRERGVERSWLLISVEAACYIGILAVAAALRFGSLGRWPLSQGEAAQAWGAWQLLHGAGPSSLDYAPLLFNLNLLNLFAFGGSDAIVRFWPALVGTLLPLLPYFLRDRLGRVGALVAALLLAISPTLVYFSRSLDGHILAALSALALVVAISSYLAERRPAAVGWGATALAAGLLSEYSFYTFLLALALWAAWAAWRGRADAESPWAEVRGAWNELVADQAWLRVGGAIVGAAVALVASALLLNPGGWQATLNVLGRWFGQFAASGDGTNLSYYARVLVAYETLPLLVGLVGLGLGLRRQDWLGVLLAIWFIVALVVHSVAGSRPSGAVVILVLPLILLAGRAVENLVATIRASEIDAQGWLFLGLGAVLFAYLYLQLVAFTFAGEKAYQTLAIVSVGVLVVCFAAFWYWMGATSSLSVGAVTFLMLLLALSVHTTWQLNLYRGRDARELVVRRTTSVDILNLAPFLEDLSSRWTRAPHVMAVLIEEDLQPVVSWYMRDFRDMRFTNAMPDAPQELAVIAMAQEGREGPGQYVAQRFRLYESAQTAGLGWGDWAKWYLRRYEIGSLESVKIEVWVKPQPQ